MLTSANPDGNTTTTAYTPATGAEPTSVTVTDPMGLATTTTYDPAGDLPLTVTDPAGYQTTKTYDALGRVTAEWTPGNATSGPAVDKYSYAVSDTAPSITTKQTEEPGGGYLTVRDVLRRPGPGGRGPGRDPRAAARTSPTPPTTPTAGSRWSPAPYYVTGAPSRARWSPPPIAACPSQTGYFYDGDGRVLRQVSYKFAAETWETDTAYGGNYTTVTPPAGRHQLDHVRQRTRQDHGDLPVPRGRGGQPVGPGSGLRQDQLHLHPGHPAGDRHRRGRQHLVLHLRPARRPDIADRPRHRAHHQQLRPGKQTVSGHRRPRQDALVHLRRRRPQDRRIRHHRRRRREQQRRTRLLDLGHGRQGPAHLVHRPTAVRRRPTPTRSPATTPSDCRQAPRRSSRPRQGATGRHLHGYTYDPTDDLRDLLHRLRGRRPARRDRHHRLRHRRRAELSLARRRTYVDVAVLHRAWASRSSTPSAPRPNQRTSPTATTRKPAA